MSRFTDEIECGSKASADIIRTRFADVVHDSDDARTKTVTVSTPMPPQARREILQIVHRSWKEDNAGQHDLTDFEREQIDFTQTTVPHARACKAIAAHHGVDDWLSYYEPELSVDENREIYERRGGAAVTMRDMDAVEAGFYR